MKAATFQGPFKVVVEDVPDPKIQEPNDVILKVTTAGICGSDVHAYDGRMNIPATGWSMGHEYIGEVVETGSGITNFKPGDRAVGSFVASCGECYFCKTGWPSQCVKQQFFGFIMLGGAQATYEELVTSQRDDLNKLKGGWIVGLYSSNWIPKEQPAVWKKGYRVVQDVLVRITVGVEARNAKRETHCFFTTSARHLTQH